MLAHAVQASTFLDDGAAVESDDEPVRINALEIFLGDGIVLAFVFGVN